MRIFGYIYIYTYINRYTYIYVNTCMGADEHQFTRGRHLRQALRGNIYMNVSLSAFGVSTATIRNICPKQRISVSFSVSCFVLLKLSQVTIIIIFWFFTFIHFTFIKPSTGTAYAWLADELANITSNFFGHYFHWQTPF